VVLGLGRQDPSSIAPPSSTFKPKEKLSALKRISSGIFWANCGNMRQS